MKKDSLIFVEHILENIEDINTFVKNIDKDKFLKNKEKQNAVIRSLEIIGEAVKNLPREITSKYTDIPWKEIAGTRDKITHHYFGVDLELIWKIVEESLPELKQRVLKIKKTFK